MLPELMDLTPYQRRMAQWRADGWSPRDLEVGGARYTQLIEEGRSEEYAFVRTGIERDFCWSLTAKRGTPYRGLLRSPHESPQAMVDYLNARGVKETCIELVVEMFDARQIEAEG